jgi:cyanophycinase
MSVMRACLLATVPMILTAGVVRAEKDEATGTVFLAGGSMHFDNAAVWNRFIELAGGKGASVVVIPAASFEPRNAGKYVADHFNHYGARAEVIDIAPQLTDVDLAAAVKDPANLQKLRKAKAIWFTGGQQRRITRALLNGDGSRTPALEAIWDAYRNGAVIGGNSAGAAVMSRQMFADALGSLETLKRGITRGKHVDAGLGFLGGEWFVDQHFLRRGRFARALLAMRDCEFKFGIGVDEDTAVVFRGGAFEVVGYKGAMVMDLRAAESDPKAPAFNLKKARLTYLASGDRIDMRTLEVTAAKSKDGNSKIDPQAPDFMPSYTQPGESFFPDMLAPGVIVDAMTQALDSKDRTVRGLAFNQAAGGDLNDLGFSFRLYRDKDTIGWYTDKGGYGSYTLVNVYVDITPVKVANPIETPR